MSWGARRRALVVVLLSPVFFLAFALHHRLKGNKEGEKGDALEDMWWSEQKMIWGAAL